MVKEVMFVEEREGGRVGYGKGGITCGLKR